MCALLSQRAKASCAGTLKSLSVIAVLVLVQTCFAGYAIVTALVTENRAPTDSGGGTNATGGGGGGHHGVDPAVFALLRDLGASAILLSVLFVSRCRTIFAAQQRSSSGGRSSGSACRSACSGFAPDRYDHGYFALLGIFGVYFGQYLFIYGVAKTGPTVASIWQNTQPVFCLIFGLCLGTERRSALCGCEGWLKIVGITCSIGGAITTFVLTATDEPRSGSTNGSSSSAMIGNVYLLVECLGGSCYQVRYVHVSSLCSLSLSLSLVFRFLHSHLLALPSPNSRCCKRRCFRVLLATLAWAPAASRTLQAETSQRWGMIPCSRFPSVPLSAVISRARAISRAA
jgi:drug/metabolite transporter (DMT)-like permease